MTDITIVTLPVERWPEFRRLRLEALSDSPQAFGASYNRDAVQPPEHWITRLRDTEEGRGLSLFAEREGQLVGMIGAFFPSGPELAMIVAMYVSPAARGSGVGRKLVEAVLDRLRAFEGATTARLMVNVEQTAALTLYRRCGFVEAGREAMQMGDGKVYDELIMERSLR